MKWTRMVAILYEAPKKSSAGIKENILLSYNWSSAAAKNPVCEYKWGASLALFDKALFKKMNILFEWIFWILKKWIIFLNEYSGF